MVDLNRLRKRQKEREQEKAELLKMRPSTTKIPDGTVEELTRRFGSDLVTDHWIGDRTDTWFFNRLGEVLNYPYPASKYPERRAEWRKWLDIWAYFDKAVVLAAIDSVMLAEAERVNKKSIDG